MATPKQSQTTTVFDYCWTQVAQAFWNRYPNPYSSHVLTEDTVIREVRDGKLYTRRLLSKTNPLPKWGERFYNSKSVKIVEDSILDPEKKILITFTQNVGFTKIMKVDEHVIYSERADGKTIVNRTAWVSSRVFGFSRAIRAFGAERFKSNCHKSTVGFNYVLKTMFPHNKPLHTMDGSTGVVAKLDHQQTKTGKLKKAAWATYNYTKSQTNKLFQLFSVKS